MERLDKVICNQTGISRKDVKDIFRKHQVMVNGEVILKSDFKVSEDDIIEINNKKLDIQKYVYLVLNKPKGYVSASIDNNDPTVLELVPDEYRHRKLFPAGRLDKDTTGLMLITDDGEFAHNILAPRKHVKKTYLVKVDKPITLEMVEKFKEGISLIDGVCKPAVLEIISEYLGKVVLTEGRYHQIKRMFACFGSTVLELKRIGMGNYFLSDDLEEGKCVLLNNEEIEKIREN